jgi:hypothetical protein
LATANNRSRSITQALSLKGDPQAAELATDVEPAWTSLRAQIEDWDAKRHAVQESQTSLKIQSRVVDNAVRVAHGAILTRKIEATDTCRRIGFHPTGRFPFVTTQAAGSPDSGVRMRTLLDEI